MSRSVLALATIVGLSGVALAADAPKTDLEKLEGTWLLAAVETAAGSTQVAAEKKVTFTFSKDKKVVLEDGELSTKGTFSINADKTPKEVDITTAKPGGEKKVLKAIYQLDGDTLKLAHSPKGAGGERPAAFDPKETVILTLKRQKP